MVNHIAELPVERHGPPDVAPHVRNFCRTVHQMAQLAALPADMRQDYAKAIVGTAEEWDRFCKRLPAPLWRDWIDVDPQPATWSKPRVSFPMDIGDDGCWRPAESDILQVFDGIDANRLRECRKCWRIFWVSRLDKDGGPFGCSDRCNNALYQRTSRERKKP
jgi:hypothetical protein